MTDADDLVNRYVLRWFREESMGHLPHLRECPDLTVTNADARDGSYGCETGCDYVRFEAVITCPHGEREEVEWGQFGELASILEDLERLENEEKA